MTRKQTPDIMGTLLGDKPETKIKEKKTTTPAKKNNKPMPVQVESEA
ncbi:unnamed protein product, partial [marine sediment metagenome]